MRVVALAASLASAAAASTAVPSPALPAVGFARPPTRMLRAVRRHETAVDAMAEAVPSEPVLVLMEAGLSTNYTWTVPMVPRHAFLATLDHQAPLGGGPLPPQFFHSLGFAPAGGDGGDGVMHGGDPGCHPTCWWNCGTADCDEVCNPVCAPPQCETACAPINLATCNQQCAPPNCAIVCPQQSCSHGDCPQCQTVCAPPNCSTVCAEQCESKCNQPSCSWSCSLNETACSKPRCTLKCGGAKMCAFDKSISRRPPPFEHGMQVLSAGLAAFDPATLTGSGPPPAAAPAAAPGAAGLPMGQGPAVVIR